jgi:hypothetical protein
MIKASAAKNTPFDISRPRCDEGLAPNRPIRRLLQHQQRALVLYGEQPTRSGAMGRRTAVRDDPFPLIIGRHGLQEVLAGSEPVKFWFVLMPGAVSCSVCLALAAYSAASIAASP